MSHIIIIIIIIIGLGEGWGNGDDGWGVIQDLMKTSGPSCSKRR